MTGGTLKVDKVVTARKPVIPSVYYVEFTTEPLRISCDNFHKGIHSIEHSFAFSYQSGSIRAHYGELTGETADHIVDISPYRESETSFGFRITSFGKLDKALLEQAIRNGLASMKSYLQAGNPVPFSTPAECGQYSFHSADLAIEIINTLSAQKLSIQEHTPKNVTPHTRWVVCDLRLLKPRPEGDINHYCFPPLVSHRICDSVEQTYTIRYPHKYAQLGTFGCMTGAYLIANCDQSQVKKLHGEIADTIRDRLSKEDPETAYGLQVVLDNITKYGKIHSN